ncbi:MAG TPA: hypothetical protein VGO59_20745 [Verrucomicrobiae bacterium]
MKINRLLALGLAIAALAASRCMAQTIITNSYTNTFDTGGATTFISGGGTSVASWLYWYGLSFGNTTMTNDPTMDADNETNSSGSLYCALPFTGLNQQVQMFGTFDNASGYDSSVVMPLNIITQMAFDIHVAPGTPTDGNGNFGQITPSIVDHGFQGGGRFGTWASMTIPGAATNGWVHMVVPTNTLLPDILSMESQGDTQAAGFGFYVQSYGGYPTNPITFWIDNVAAVAASIPPPPPPPPTMSIAAAQQGLNLFAGAGAGLNNRESLETIGSIYSWVGASGPVSYSFTLTNYPIATNAQFQTHIFLDPNPSTGSAPDYSDPNCIFFDLESTASGGVAWMFRYKTNEPQGNTMVYGSGTLATVGSSNILGTYIATFNNNTNVTMTMPDGTSTNFSIPDTTGDTTALFASGVVAYFGVQANNSVAVSSHIVASDFSISGLGSGIDFNDNFIADDGALNSSIWEINAVYPSCVKFLTPADVYYVYWSTPAIGYSLQESPTLLNPDWTTPTTYTSFVAGTNDAQLINTNDLPGGNMDFFSVVKRNFTNLLVLLPGETNAPNTPTGKIGTPFSYGLITNGGVIALTATVIATDAKFYPVSGISDMIQVTDNAGGSDPTPANLANGTGQYTVYFTTAANGIVITAADTTTPSTPVGNSSTFNISN